MQWAQLAASVAGGVAVAAIVSTSRAAWARRRMPRALSQVVKRRQYLSEVHAIARETDVERLDALLPNLAPASTSRLLRSVQETWQEIDRRDRTRVVTREEEQCLTAAAELLGRGIETRISHTQLSKDLSFHLFRGSLHRTVLNLSERGKDHPSRLCGKSVAAIFQAEFDRAWDAAVPVESVLAEYVVTELRRDGDLTRLATHLRDLRDKYSLGTEALEAVLRHVAFRHSAPVIFITGLPGAGKSTVRRLLKAKLDALRLQVTEENDYLYAFHDFLHGVMLLEGERGKGFSASQNGAFQIDDEDLLKPALNDMALRISARREQASIALVEFARSDIGPSLGAFGHEITSAAHLIYVRTSAETRAERLRSRAQPPRINVMANDIRITLSDDHRLPPAVAESLYLTDDFARVQADSAVGDRCHVLDNDLDDRGHTRIEEKLDGFVEDVIRPYRAAAAF
ncbi:AAA family ATPase [Lentzea sp. NPDC058436]|uniref:AAA family ATPase n=1 Tax=Lentzea sp. NPDC058436 TaxID=3346499 RepID=UPI00365A83A8